MPEVVFRTRECAQHGHPEFTLRFTQFLALPVETVVGIEGPGRIRARVMIDGEIVTPLDGSYLAALNDPKTLR